MPELQTKTTMPTIKLPQNKNSLFELVLLGIIAILMFIFIVNPKRTELTQAKDNADKQKSAFDATRGEQVKLDALVQSMKSDPKALAELDEALPLSDRISRLRLTLEYISKSSAMSIGDISVSGGTEQVVSGDRERLADPYSVVRKLQKFDCSMTVTGSMEQFQSLLQKLENNGRILDISGIDVSSSKDNALQFKVNMSAYAYE